MSEHTKGRLVAEKSTFDWNVNLDWGMRGTMCSDIEEGDARRLAAAWNACEGMTTEAIEALAGIGSLGDLKASELDASNARIAKLEALAQQQDTWLGKKTCAHSRCNELNAARALLREVAEKLPLHSLSNFEWAGRVQAYVDACDTLEGK